MDQAASAEDYDKASELMDQIDALKARLEKLSS